MLESKVFTVHNKSNEPIYLTIPAFDETKLVKHCFSTRVGGVSSGPFATLNLASGSFGGIIDAKENVKENFRRLCRTINVNPLDMVFSKQEHGDNILLVQEEDRGWGTGGKKKLSNIDALITKIPNLPIATFYADCVPIMLLDPETKSVGLVHSGWRGTVKKIAAKTVAAMTTYFGASPANILAGIMPSICVDCYEVDAAVAFAFREALGSFSEFCVMPGQGSKYQIDLAMANKLILRAAGLKELNIAITDLCTKCHNEYFFSHRGQNGKRGLLGAIIQLN